MSEQGDQNFLSINNFSDKLYNQIKWAIYWTLLLQDPTRELDTESLKVWLKTLNTTSSWLVGMLKMVKRLRLNF